MTTTAIILPVPEAEDAVGPWRARYDKHAAQGVPAHITLLSPFLPMPQAAAAWAEVCTIVGPQAPAFSLRHFTGWDGLGVLQPEPLTWFLDVSQALCRRWSLRPYGGHHGDEIQPHLTVAYGATQGVVRDRAGTAARFDRIAAALEPGLPLHCLGRQILLLERMGQTWHARKQLTLSDTVV